MAGNWTSVPLSELTAVPATYGVVQPGAETSGGVPMLRVNNFQEHTLNLSGVMRIAPEIEAKYERTRIQTGDVLITIVGSVGQVAIVPEALAGWNIARAVAMIRPNEPELSRWISLVLRSPQAQYQLGVAANTTVQTTINLKDLRELRIPLPDKKEREAIVRILGALDDKLELNRRTNETLEAMARALFKSWFVDFDDVAESELVESELGLIPKGWRVEALGNHLNVLETGRRPKGGVKDISEGVPSVGAESIIGIGQFDFGKTKYVAEDFFVGMKSGHVQSLDVMLYKDGGKPGDFRPRVSMFGEGFPFERYAINEHVFRMRSESLGQAYLFLQISHERILNDLRNRGGKAAIPGINQKDVTTLQVLIPDDSVIESFNNLVVPMLEAILKRANESRTLAQLRDALLPKLLSGELRVKDAEHIAMEAA
ncbi:restriction endonuclease subunit S [Lysobacter fragariae]